MNCLASHFGNIKVLRINKNKIGQQGAARLAEILGSLKVL
jgi:hypothetical protein